MAPVDYALEVQGGDTATITQQTGEFDIEITLSDQIVVPVDLSTVITTDYIAARLPTYLSAVNIAALTDGLAALNSGYDANTHILQMRGQASTSWSSTNPVLRAREIGVETNTGKFKIGDNTTQWNSLAYAGGGTGSSITDNGDGTATV